jgi:hypothetical protein
MLQSVRTRIRHPGLHQLAEKIARVHHRPPSFWRGCADLPPQIPDDAIPPHRIMRHPVLGRADVPATVFPSSPDVVLF